MGRNPFVDHGHIFLFPTITFQKLLFQNIFNKHSPKSWCGDHTSLFVLDSPDFKLCIAINVPVSGAEYMVTSTVYRSFDLAYVYKFTMIVCNMWEVCVSDVFVGLKWSETMSLEKVTAFLVPAMNLTNLPRQHPASPRGRFKSANVAYVACSWIVIPM